MKLTQLNLVNIGPFRRASVSFQTKSPAVTLITGENGTGKSILIDSIRMMFNKRCCVVDREVAASSSFKIELQTDQLPASSCIDGTRSHTIKMVGGWVADFWRVQSPDCGGFAIDSLARLSHDNWQEGALQGTATNTDTTQLLCYYDYLRDSRDPDERSRGEQFWSVVKRIIAQSVPGGELRPIRRESLQPVVRQHGRDLTLGQLSAGSLYAITRLLRLLGRMYSCTHGQPLDHPIAETPGLLLIDEPENHLHPKWQKRFLSDVLAVFPNLQIIAATHSPFIVGSVEGAQVLRCKAVEDGCVIQDVSATYSRQTVDEVLASEAFTGTSPYGTEVDGLVQERKRALERYDEAEVKRLEAALIERNPDAFAGYRLQDLLSELANAS